MVFMLIVLQRLARAVRIACDACACRDDVCIACVVVLMAISPKDMAPAGAPYFWSTDRPWRLLALTL